MGRRSTAGAAALVSAVFISLVAADPFPPTWDNGAGPATHFSPVAWPQEPADPLNCGDTCGDWKPYTRFQQNMNDPRTRDPSNGGTAPQAYVNVASSCSDTSKPSIYYHLHQGATEAEDVLMFRWRVESAAHNYATGPNAGNFSSGNPWSSALWTVLFDIDGSGYRSLAAHLDGSTGSPSKPIDMLVGIWGNTASHSLDYVNDSNVHLLGHNPTAFVGPNNKILNFNNQLSPNENWPNGSGETVWDYGTTRASVVSTNSCDEYFIDYQIPIALLDASEVGGPKITRSTPISMLFCTANSLNNPFQKDCAINKAWSADALEKAPFGDYLSFNQAEPYRQPIISSVTAAAPASCPGPYTLSANVQDTLALENGDTVSSVKAVDFFYWYDSNADGLANDAGSTWTKVPGSAALEANSANKWIVSWNATELLKGKYLIGVQAVDDYTKLDDGMVPSGIDNRTFSYLSGDAENKIFINGSWATGQESAFPDHSPLQSPGSGENWYGNPSVTGQQVAVVGTAINACGIAPTISLAASPDNVVGGAALSYTVTLQNPVKNTGDVTVSQLTQTLPADFSYQMGTSVGSGGLASSDPTILGQTLTWTYGAPVSLAPGAIAELFFDVSASTTGGNYNSTAQAETSFGTLESDPVAVAVDSARVSLALTPSAYSIAADGSSQLTFVLDYANDSTVTLSSTTLEATLPSGVNYIGCVGGCSQSGSTVTWALDSLPGKAIGDVSLTLTVPGTWTSSSLSLSATLSAIAPDASTVNTSRSSSVAVTGYDTSAAAFSLVKTASAVQIAPGDSLTYTLAYENYGSATATDVVISDTLPAGMTFSSCLGGCTNSGGVVTWSLGSVAAGVSGSVSVSVIVDNPFTAANPVENTATIDWAEGGAVTSTIASVGITGQACSTYYFQNTMADVGFDGIRRVAQVSPVPLPADTGTAVTVTAPPNNSYAEALRFYQDPAALNDLPFDGNITTNIYIDRANGSALNIRTSVYDYDSVSGTRTLLVQHVESFNGSTKGLLSFTVTPTGTLAKDHRLLWLYEVGSAHTSQSVVAELQFAGTVTNSISGGTTFADSNANFCVTPPANLTTTITANPEIVDPGTTPTVAYAINYANTGSASASNVLLSAVLPPDFTACEFSTDNVNWSVCSGAANSPADHSENLGSLAAGASGAVYLRGKVPAGTLGGETFTATTSITSDQTSTISASADTVVSGGVVGGTPSLDLYLSASASSAAPGDSIVYTVTVVNTGSADATNVVVSNSLPSATYFSYGSCTGGCTNSADTLQWSFGTLAAGGSATVTYTMNVGSSGLASGITVISDDASAAADGLSATSNQHALSINGNPQLTGVMTATPASGLRPGDTITYNLTVSNEGSADATAVVVDNPIPAYLSFAGNLTTSTGTGSFDAVNNRILFKLGTLATGANAVLSFEATIAELSSGTTTITSTATASADNAAQRNFSASATATAEAVLDLTHRVSGSGAYPAAVLTADANGTSLLVDRTDRLQVNQLIAVNGTVARILSVGSSSVSLDSNVIASSGDSVVGGITLSISYRNSGDATAIGASLSETLPSGLLYYSASPSATSAPAVGSSGTVQWSLGSLAAGSSGTASVIAFPSGLTGTLTSTARLEASNALAVTADADLTVGGIAVAKTTSTPTVSPGGIATYEITLSNSLSTSVGNIELTDTLATGFTYRSGSALVGGFAVEPDSAVEETVIWSGLTVPANGTLMIAFDADVNSDTGAAVYHNEADIAVPAGTGKQDFDSLASKAEDVSVLAANTGVLKGYVFERSGGTGSSFDRSADLPLSGVRVEIYQSGADCSDPYSATCAVTYTDGDGYFEETLPADSWYVNVVSGTGDLDSTWSQVVGDNNTLVQIVDQDTTWDHNGFAFVDSWTVTASAGAGGIIDPASRTVSNGDTTSFTITPDTGYRIDAIAGTCGGNLVGNVYTTNAITANCSVEATFALATYTVSFDLDGGTHTGGGALSQTVSHGSAATAPTFDSPTGKTFDAWSTPFDNVTSDLTVTALYVTTTYAVTFDLAGGTHTGGGALSQSVAHGGAATAPTLEAPTGKVFAGWSTPFDNVRSALTVTALYTDASYAVTFNLDGGTRTGGGALNQSVIHGGAAVEPTLNAPIGKVVAGWDLPFDNVTSSLTVTALYNDASYAVTFNLDGGTRTGGGALNQSVTHGGAAVEPSLDAPTGKVFAGWDLPFDNVTSALTVTALYNDASYPVTFDLAGGTHTGGGALDQTVTHGGAATAPTFDVPVGKTFSAWSSAFDNVTAALTVTALYADTSHAVTFDLDGGVHTGGGELSQTVAHGQAAAEPTFAPPEGKVFVGWSTEFHIITAATAVTALYESETYIVTPSVEGANGTISPADAQTIAHGERAVFTATPAEGFVTTVSGSCGGTLDGNTFTTEPTTADCTIVFAFAEELILTDENGEPYTGEKLARDSSRTFRVSGGEGELQLEASVLQGGDFSVLGEQVPDDFFGNHGASLIDNGDGTYSFSARRAGVYELTFTDESGQRVALVFLIYPQVVFESARQVGSAGEPVIVTVLLDDEPFEYPVVIPTTVRGHELSSDLSASHAFSLDSGKVASLQFVPINATGDVFFDLLSQGLQGAALGSLTEHRVKLVSPELLPLAGEITLVQDADTDTLIVEQGGPVTLFSPLTGSGYSYDWSASAPALAIGGFASDQVSFDPSGLEGSYTVKLTITEVAAPHRRLELTITVRVVSQMPEEYEKFYDERYSQSPNRLPICIENGMRRVQACSDELKAIYAETLSSYEIRLGKMSDHASWRDREFALSVEAEDLLDESGLPAANREDIKYEHLGYHVDFEISGLKQPGQSVPVVIPLKPGITLTEQSVWRKYMGRDGWQSFVVDEANHVSSTTRDGAGECPWPGADTWKPGFNAGDDCIRLLIQDGGPNDEDGTADGIVRDPGVLAVPSAEPTSIVTTVGKGGGGALGIYALAFLLMLNIWRRRITFVRAEGREDV